MPPQPQNGLSDEELVSRTNQGDAEAFEVLYYRHRDWVVQLAFRFSGNREDALDVLQDTFAYFLEKFPGFELSAGLRTFFYPTVKHLSLAIRRKKVPAAFNDEYLEQVSAPAPMDPEGARRELAAVLQSLGQEHREVLLMRFVDDLSLAEIAEALEIPVGTVKSRLHQALARLREDPRTQAYFETSKPKENQ